MHVAKTILESLKKQPEQIAIRLPNGVVISNENLRRQTILYSALLDNRGVQAGDRVLIQISDGIGLGIACLATMLIGGIPVLASMATGSNIYREEIRITDPKWWIVDRKLFLIQHSSLLKFFVELLGIQVPPYPAMPKQRTIKFKMASRSSLKNGDIETSFQARSIDSNIDAGLAFTGGTTSKPKCVRYSHDVMEAILQNITNLVTPKGSAGFLADNPLQAFYALYAGKTVFLPKQKNKSRFLYERIMDGSVDTYFSSPYLWKEIIDICKSRQTTLPSSMRTILLGASPVSKEFLAELSAWVHDSTEIICIYGLTEAGPVCTISARDKLAWKGDGDLVGRPLRGYEIKIDQSSSSGSDVGEVIIHGEPMFPGYLNEAPRIKSEGFKTGDLGRLVQFEGEAMLVLTGRKKDMIIRKGVNIYPTILEAHLSDYQRQKDLHCFLECAVAGIWRPESEDEEVALCFIPDDINFNEAGMQTLATDALGETSLIDHCLSFSEFPVIGRQNKLDRKQLSFLADQKLRSVS